MPLPLPKLSEHCLTAAFSLFSAVDSIEPLTQNIGPTAVKETALASRKIRKTPELGVGDLVPLLPDIDLSTQNVLERSVASNITSLQVRRQAARYHTRTDRASLALCLLVLGDIGTHGVPHQILAVARVDHRELEINPPLEQVAINAGARLVRHVHTLDLLERQLVLALPNPNRWKLDTGCRHTVRSVEALCSSRTER